jgi:hypothetical protein
LNFRAIKQSNRTPHAATAMRKPSKPKHIPRKHAVYANLNVPELTKAGSGLELYIYASGEKLGEVDIGRGGFYWKGGRRHRRKRISWTDFAAKMDELAYGRR